jgi:hypothetical protein
LDDCQHTAASGLERSASRPRNSCRQKKKTGLDETRII